MKSVKLLLILFLILKGGSQTIQSLTKKVQKKFTHERLIKKYEDTFNATIFSEKAQQIYINAHEALTQYLKKLFFLYKSILFHILFIFLRRDNEKLLEYATEHAYAVIKIQFYLKYLLIIC